MEKREQHWNAVTSDGVGLYAIGMGLFITLLFRSTPGFIFAIDHANVFFREVGHSIVAFLKPQYQAYGGAIAQLALPIITLLGFRRQGRSLWFATATVWFSENLLNIAHSIGDPGAKSPPMIGGADQDWITVFGRLGLLRYENDLLFALTTAAWVGMGLACLFVLWRAWQSRRRTARVGQLVSVND